MPSLANSGRLSKDGFCAQCQSRDVVVQWDDGSKMWLCRTCWPLPVRKTPKTEWEQAWDARNPTEAARLALRDTLYGIRIEDDEKHPSSFVVRCPSHGIVGMDLMIVPARRLLDDHIDEHVPTM